MSGLYALLERIKKRPEMYLETRSLTLLHTLLKGYSIACGEINLPETEEDKQLNDFAEWIPKRFNITSNQSWAKIILFFSGNEEKAFYTFYELFEEYLNGDKNIEASTVAGTDDRAIASIECTPEEPAIARQQF